MSPLDPERTRELYDRFGARQDRQGWYEDPATDDLVAHADFPAATAVVELGCGTGRFAETLLGGPYGIPSGIVVAARRRHRGGPTAARSRTIDRGTGVTVPGGRR